MNRGVVLPSCKHENGLRVDWLDINAMMASLNFGGNRFLVVSQGRDFNVEVGSTMIS